jgi:hypothetical protein
MSNIDEITRQILLRRRTVPDTRCMLVGVSGMLILQKKLRHSTASIRMTLKM